MPTLDLSLSAADITRVAKTYARRKNVVLAWGMGMTHHLHGVSNVEAIANLALLRGMIGRRFAGQLPFQIARRDLCENGESGGAGEIVGDPVCEHAAALAARHCSSSAPRSWRAKKEKYSEAPER